MRSILILDDDEIRHDIFDKMYPGDDITHCYRYFEFIENLEDRSPWDIIHFDHDLCDQTKGDTYIDNQGETREYNGYHAALKVCDLPNDKLPVLSIVHSLNPSGAESIAKCLKRRGLSVIVKPFDYNTNGGTDEKE